MNRFLVLVLGSVIAFLILKYRRSVQNFTGDIPWAERVMPGGTNTFIVFFGVGVFILSLMYALGTLQSVFQVTFGRFFF